jgi:hypothetical protein
MIGRGQPSAVAEAYEKADVFINQSILCESPRVIYEILMVIYASMRRITKYPVVSGIADYNTTIRFDILGWP